MTCSRLLRGWMVLSLAGLVFAAGCAAPGKPEPGQSAAVVPFTPSEKPADSVYASIPAGKLDATLAELKAQVAKDPNELTARTRLAWVLARYKNDNAGAMGQVQAILAKRPNDFAANELATQIYAYNGDGDPQFDALMKLLNTDDNTLPLRMFVLYNLRSQNHSREDRLIAALDNIRANSPAHFQPTTAAYAAWYEAAIVDGLGRNADADKLRGSLGMVRDWALIGPFKNERGAGFAEAFGPETEIDFAKEYPGRVIPVKWRKLNPAFLPRSGVLDFSDYCYPTDQVLAYALTYVNSPVEQDAVLRIGAEDSIKAWFNDRLVLAEDQETTFSLDQYAVPVKLHKGWNKILVKVGRREGNWELVLRLTDPAGMPLAASAHHPTYSNEPQKTPDESKAAAPTFAYVGSLVEEAKKTLTQNPDNERALLQLALAQDYCGWSERAVLAGEKVLAANPQSVMYRLLMADLYMDNEKPEQAQDQLFTALKLDPKCFTAQEMLTRFYLRRHLKDKALTAAEALQKQHPDNVKALDLLRDAYSAKEFAAHRYRLSDRLQQRLPEDRQTLLTWARELSEMGRRDKYRAVVRQIGARWPNDGTYRSLLNQEASEAKNDQKLLDLNAEEIRLYPENLYKRYRRAELLMGLERYDEALQVLNEAAALNPQSPEIDYLKGEIAMRRNQDPEAIRLWQSALVQNPENGQLRDYVEFMRPTRNPAFAKYEVPDEKIEEIIKKRVNPRDYPKANSALLLDFAVTQLFEDASSQSLEHQIIQIFNEQGRDEWKTFPLHGLNPKVKRARVVKPDGREEEATEIRGGQIHFARLQPGDIIEVKWESHAGDQGWLSRHWTHSWGFQSEQPFLHSEFVLLSPPSRPIKEMILNGEGVQRSEETFDGQKVTRWLAENVPVPEVEPNRPPLRVILKNLMLTTIPTWDEIAAWEWSMTKDQFKADEAVKAKVAELTKGLTKREDKIKAIADFVMQKIQYKQDYVTSIMGVKPHNASQVLARQRGDCKDKATLLITMLNEVGIPAEYVTLLTRDRGNFYQDLPTNQGNHAICYVPGENGQPGRYIDGTALFQPYTVLPALNQGVTAVHLVNGKFVFREIPLDAPEKNLSQTTIQADLNANGSAAGSVQMKMNGNFAPGFRMAMQTPDVFRQQLEQVVGGMYPGAKVQDWSHSDPNDRYADADVTLKVQVPRLLEGSNGRLVVRVPENLRLQATRSLTPQDKRTYDIWLSTSRRRIIEQVYKVPEGLEVESLPQPGQLSTPWITFDRKVNTQDGKITIVTTMDVKAVKIPRSGYDELRKFAIEVDRLDRQDIVLVRTGPDAAATSQSAEKGEAPASQKSEK